MNEQSACPICESRSLSDFLFRGQTPVHQNLLMRDQAAAVGIPRGDLALVVCGGCGFIFNRAFDPRKIMYGEDYENTQACSPSFNEYLDGLVRHMVSERNVRDCNVVEVGCGNGLFLRKLVTYEGAGNRGYGFDPSYTGAAGELDGRLTFATRYYDSECADIPADVIVCRHVIEHVPRPLALLRDIKKALAHAPAARIFFETPCVEWILRNRVIWDFFYEHCSYFTAESLSTAFRLEGFEVESVSHVFGGQYLWLEAKLPAAAATETPGDERRGAEEAAAVAELATAFARAETELREEWGRNIRALAATEKVALWGAGAKGVTFANLIDAERRWLDCIVDLNPQKQGHYVPGTGHPIVSYTDLARRGVTAAILMNPNYHQENLALLQAVGADVRLLEQL
ncbi:MAG TPA: methyltransferase domain-containing protein [Pyrinomonadaceae bacterium]|nr:methyltransferase domain-containing protein [Pyrinomonadaceae bacterium]